MLLHDPAIVPAKRNVGLLKCGARRRHTRCPLPRVDFGTSRFEGNYAKSSRFHRREEYGPADVAVELNSTEAAEAARPCASALPEKRRSGVKMRSVAEWQRTDSCPAANSIFIRSPRRRWRAATAARSGQTCGRLCC